MLSERSLKIIRQSSGPLKKPVRLVLFTADRGCADCPAALDLVKAIKAHADKVALETYDMVMDRDKTEQYGIAKVPAIVVQGVDGQAVTFYGLIEDVFLEILMSTIHALSDAKVWFPEDVRRALNHLTHDVSIRVFVETDCPLCRPVADTAIGLALESTYIQTAIIVASDFPELIRKHNIRTLPKTIFGENLHMDGHVTESEFLEMIFQAEGIRPSSDRRCLVCSKPSPDLICSNCKTRIQAEAIDHKTKMEKGLQQP
jgi:hypothetical protein